MHNMGGEIMSAHLYSVVSCIFTADNTHQHKAVCEASVF